MKCAGQDGGQDDTYDHQAHDRPDVGSGRVVPPGRSGASRCRHPGAPVALGTGGGHGLMIGRAPGRGT